MNDKMLREALEKIAGTEITRFYLDGNIQITFNKFPKNKEMINEVLTHIWEANEIRRKGIFTEACALDLARKFMFELEGDKENARHEANSYYENKNYKKRWENDTFDYVRSVRSYESMGLNWNGEYTEECKEAPHNNTKRPQHYKVLRLLTKYFNTLESDYSEIIDAINAFDGVNEYLEDLGRYLTTKRDKEALEYIKKEVN